MSNDNVGMDGEDEGYERIRESMYPDAYQSHKDLLDSLMKEKKMYKIVINMETRRMPLTLQFENRRDAMDAWDDHVDDALPGAKLQLIDVENGRIMSEYTPVGSEWRNV